MAYSNITPPTLPEYDSVLYSHYVLEFEYENGSENWFAVSLRYSSTPFTYDGAAVTNAGEHHLQTYGSGTGEWTYWGTLTEMYNIDRRLPTDLDKPQYSGWLRQGLAGCQHGNPGRSEFGSVVNHEKQACGPHHGLVCTRTPIPPA